MSQEKVSIIVPVYNCEKYICRCIESILSQSYTSFEIILVDDGSKDNSNTICKKFKDIDKRVKVFYQENSGASVARNCGLENSSGEYIMFVDADDHIDSNMLQELVNVAKREESDFVMCGMVVDTYNSKRDLISSVEYNLTPRIILGNNNIPLNIVDLVENEKISGPCCKLIRRDIIKQYEIEMPPHISLQEDLYFNLKVLEHVNKMCVIDGCYYHYNKGLDESVTSRYYPNKYEMTNEVHELLIRFYEDRCNDKEILARIKYIYIKNIYAAFINLFHPECKMSKKRKLENIRMIIKSDKYENMIISAYKKGLKYNILKLVLKTRNSKLIYYVSKLFYIMKYKLGFRY
ncbi:glycosyltransferase family 2 protein [Clostridium cochlearium]|uniref:glycosyltransferase family 2 protein n=1 Tax=Clostridium cochlearium TaxID=1494 RepID=UPI0022E3634A|nr:glycosyltransferase family 2 protein [Clostridium cochlearium]